jgi:hypothetical protein
MDKTFASCSSGKDAPVDVWKVREPDNFFRKEACSSVSFKRGEGFYDIDCVDLNMINVICEVRHSKYNYA